MNEPVKDLGIRLLKDKVSVLIRDTASFFECIGDDLAMRRKMACRFALSLVSELVTWAGRKEMPQSYIREKWISLNRELHHLGFAKEVSVKF